MVSSGLATATDGTPPPSSPHSPSSHGVSYKYRSSSDHSASAAAAPSSSDGVHTIAAAPSASLKDSRMGQWSLPKEASLPYNFFVRHPPFFCSAVATPRMVAAVTRQARLLDTSV